jgi:predicted ATPase with chaperone activity
MARDEYGAEVDVRDGLPSFTIVGYPDGRQHAIAETLRHRLGGLWPQRRITVNVPDGWAPHDLALAAMARAIHRAHSH